MASRIKPHRACFRNRHSPMFVRKRRHNPSQHSPKHVRAAGTQILVEALKNHAQTACFQTVLQSSNPKIYFLSRVHPIRGASLRTSRCMPLRRGGAGLGRDTTPYEGMSFASPRGYLTSIMRGIY